MPRHFLHLGTPLPLGERGRMSIFRFISAPNYQDGKYGWTTDLDTIKRSVDWQMESLKTDYIDFGFLHCIDEKQDLHHCPWRADAWTILWS